MKLKNSKIALQRPGPYRPGDMLQGTTSWMLERDIKVRQIKLVFHGSCKVKWKKGSGDDEKTYKSHEIYFDHIITLYGNANGQDISLSAGQFRCPFQFQLPGNSPSTFCSCRGNVLYCIQLEAEYSGAFTSNDSYVIPFNVIAPVDPRPWRQLRLAKECEDSGCCGAGATVIKFEVNTDKNLYNPGDSIILNGYVMNGGSESLKKVKLILSQKLTYIGKRSDFSFTSSGNFKSKEKAYTVAEWKGEEVAARATLNFVDRGTIRIPDDIPESDLKNCHLIDVKYSLVFKVALPGFCSFEVFSSPAEVFIGNSASHATASSESGVLPSAPPVTLSFNGPSMVQTTNNVDLAPSYDAVATSRPVTDQPPSYGEAINYASFLPSDSTREQNSTQPSTTNTQGNYYDWSQSAFTYS